MPTYSHPERTHLPRALQTGIFAMCAALAILAAGFLLCAGEVPCLSQVAESTGAELGVAADGPVAERARAQFIIIF